MSISEAHIVINLWGSFSVASGDATDLTPRLKKCQALIAILATSPEGKRSRTWLQSHLWSDRSSEQASGSLRQALTAIRNSLGDFGHLLTANRQCVQLDMSKVKLAEPDRDQEFLEGLDVNDNEFDDWLRLERAHQFASHHLARPLIERSLAPQSPPMASSPIQNPVIVLLAGGTGDQSTNAIETFLIDSVARSLRENLSIPTYTHDVVATFTNALKVQLNVSQLGEGQLFLTANCVHAASCELLWSDNRMVQVNDFLPVNNVAVLSWLNEIVAAIADFLGRPGELSKEHVSATQFGLAALRELFSLDPSRVAQADHMLKQAYEIDPRAIFTAWRAQLRGIQHVERHGNSSKELREEGLMLAQKALQAEPSNSSILATTANARLILDQDIAAAEELSRDSLRLNPSNPLAWWSRSFTYLYSDRIEEAVHAGERGRQLSKGSPYRFWWDMQLALSASAARNYDKAIQSAERCAAFSSTCRPPLRYLIALHAEGGSMDRASHWTQKLKLLEPDFSVERLLTDGDYPASLLRKYNLVKTESLSPLKELS